MKGKGDTSSHAITPNNGNRSRRKARHWPAMTEALARLYFLAISFTGAFLFVAVEKIEPNRRFAFLLKCAILAAGGAAIASQLVP
jgi:hypothetical protein